MNDAGMTIVYRVDLDAPQNVIWIGTLLVQGDDSAHKIVAELYRGRGKHNPADDVTAMGVFVRSDGYAVALGGDIAGNTVSITLDGACYAVAGPCYLSIVLNDHGGERTVLKAAGRVDQDENNGYIDETVYTSFDALVEAAVNAYLGGTIPGGGGGGITGPYVSSVNGQSGAVTLKTGDLENNSGFITKTVSDLTNYYLKSETYTREEINQRISQIPKFAISVVSTLPATGDANTIYLVGGGISGNLYTEYIWADGAWEILGSQRVDLTGYATETWVSGQLGSYLKASELVSAINTALAQAAASGEFDGDDGVGIAGVSFTRSPDEYGFYYINIELTDGNVYPVPYKQGSDGVSVTHEWNGTTLTVTSASGTSSVNLQGPKGDPGGDYVLNDADRAEIIAEIQSTANQQTPLFANSVDDCTDTTKVYVLPDGYIYGYILKAGVEPEITTEHKTGGYWRSDATGFVWNTASGITTAITNKIPVTPGDQLSYKGQVKYGTNKSVIWFDSSGAIISSQAIASLSKPTTVTAPSGAASAQFTSFNEGSAAATLVVEWVSCQAAAPSYRWANTGHAFVPADYESRIAALENSIGETASILKGKKIVYDGDSIAESRTGSSANNGGAYAKLIADATGCGYVNHAKGGARLTTKPADRDYHSVVDNLPNLPKDGDLYCFEGGINDYWTPKTLGTFSKTDFTGTLDTSTICGALETIFRYALTNFVGKAICFVITHKIQSTAYTANANGNTFEDYRNAMVGICQKYSVPYYDAFSESGLNGWNTVQNNAFLTSNANGTADGCHPNAEGYKRYYVPQLISLFERIMPREQRSVTA